MFSFKGFQTRAKNKHLEHLEDQIIDNGSKGGQNAVNFLVAIRNMLAGKSSRGVNMTVKWDGAPAIICGINPENGRFFVGTKSVFNKTPKVNFTTQDIKNNHTGEVANILQDCLRYLSGIGMKEILQGDLLYRNSTLKKTTYKSASGKSEQMISFQPNTIVYMVPEASGLGRKINSSKLGIIFHTTYKGRSIDKLKASFGANVKKLRRTPSVFFDDASYKDSSGVATFTTTESAQYDSMLRMAMGSISKGKRILELLKRQTNMLSVGMRLKIFFNTQIRAGQSIQNVRKLQADFRKYYAQVLDDEASKKKTANAKKKYEQIRNDGLRFIDSNDNDIYFAIASYITLQRVKNFLVSKMNQIKSMGTFLQKGNGFVVTNPEGYVAVDRMGNAVKLVDRLEFSTANFTLAKNWIKG